jgi:hypothetical protein
MKVRETKTACWTVFHFIAPLMRSCGERWVAARSVGKIQRFGEIHKSKYGIQVALRPDLRLPGREGTGAKHPVYKKPRKTASLRNENVQLWEVPDRKALRLGSLLREAK